MARTPRQAKQQHQHVFENNHIILLTETWTNDHPEIHVDGFEESVLNRTLKCSNAKRDSGGLTIYVSDKMAHSVSLIRKLVIAFFGLE